MHLAAIDIGTNSTRLLVAQMCGETLYPVCRELLTTRLGAKLQEKQLLSASGKALTLAAVRSFVSVAKEYNVESIHIIATSAMRDARDGHAFAGELSQIVNIPVIVIPSAMEAAYSFTGVTKSLQTDKSLLVFDLGGGSCELIWQKQDTLHSESYKIGALYMTDAYFFHDPPQDHEIYAARQHIKRCFSAVPFEKKQLVGVGGTVTSLAAMVLGLSVYDPEQIHGFSLSKTNVERVLAAMLTYPTALRAQMPGIHINRARILPAGAIVIDELFAAADASKLIVSEGDLLLGCLYASISSASV